MLYDDSCSKEKLSKFRLSKDELNEFYAQYWKVYELNKNLIKHIQNLNYSVNIFDFCIHSLPFLNELIHIIVQLRKESTKNPEFEYEYIKFCELFYHSLFFIMKNEKELRTKFFEFSVQVILPILERIKTKWKNLKFYFFFDLKINLVFYRKYNNENRRNSLINFLLKFLNSQKVKIDKKKNGYYP